MNNNFVLIALLFVGLVKIGNAHAQACSNELEESLAQMPKIFTEPRAENSPGELDARCITSSMDVFYGWTLSLRAERAAEGQTDIGHYGYCESSDQKKVKRLHTPPCQSELYVNVIKNSYNDVLSCLELDPKNLFAITSVESGFHINTFSLSSQDIGIGQLIPEAIREVNAFWADSVVQLEQSEKTSCQNLRPIITGLTSAPSEGKTQACSMMALPENPVRNLLYLGLLHKFNEKKIEQYFEQSRMPERLKLQTGVEWSEEELKKLREVLVFLAYNAGLRGAKQMFDAFINLKQANLLSWNQKHQEIYQSSIDLYLEAMDLEALGRSEEAQVLLNQREKLYADLGQLKENRQELHIPKAMYFANETPGSFGEYLLRTNSSNYVSVLIGRIKYIEASLAAPGLCGPNHFLQAP